ncbi:hypothetical protein ACFQV2_37070 [Actinokineospora soli]|uniref:Sporadically distributed protein, TIGR04141 family n=1 Tax=Actinokineospora soli TaxID=1048753 RepID=A0ABW2TZI5_9PSEU
MKEVSYAGRIGHALELSQPQAAIDGVKAAVTDELKALDPKIEVVRTDYFNHTYIPDLVIRWPRESSTFERYVYLRSNSDIDYLAEEVGIVSENKPIVFGLDTFPAAGPTSPEMRRLSQSLRHSDTLVTDADSLSVFARNDSSRFRQLTSSAITKGGRGVIDEQTATSASEDLDAGFDGAMRVDRESTSRGVSTLDLLLAPQFSNRISRLLQAIWVGAGGRLEDYPGKTSLTAEISDDSLQFLFDLDVEIVNAEFWGRVGRFVELEQLSRLLLPNGSSNFTRFMKVNHNNMWARCCRLSMRHATLDRDENDRFWFIDNGNVGLNVGNHAVYVAQKTDKLGNVQPVGSDAISVAALKKRARNLVVRDAEFYSGKLTVRFSSDDGQGLLADDQLDTLVSQLDDGAAVKKIEVTLPGGRHMTFDFGISTSTGRTQTRLAIKEIVSMTLQLVGMEGHLNPFLPEYPF